jgi:hypothetical protein
MFCAPAFPLVKILLSALSRNENARDHLGPGVFVFSVLPVGFRPKHLAVDGPAKLAARLGTYGFVGC